MSPPTCRDVIRRALRKLKVIAAGEEPDADDANDALETLEALYGYLYGLGVFGRMIDTIVTTSTYAAHEQERIQCKNEGGVQVTLPATRMPICTFNWPLDYGWWEAGIGCCDFSCDFASLSRPPRDGACIGISDFYSSFEQTWVYDAPSSRWVLITGLNLSVPAPLSGRYSEGLACMLACRMAPEYSVQPDQETAAGSVRGQYAMTHRYDVPRRAAIGEFM